MQPPLPHMKGDTVFWGVHSSWVINTDEKKDLRIRMIIRLNNQQIEERIS
jgi:hypothetical protein